jgi:hypothetical protein
MSKNEELIAEARQAISEQDARCADLGIEARRGSVVGLFQQMADALEAAELPTTPVAKTEREALIEKIGNHVASEYDDDPHLDRMIVELRAMRPAPTTVEWGIKWAEIIPGFLDIAIGYESESLANAAAGRSAFPGTVVSRNASAGPWIEAQS